MKKLKKAITAGFAAAFTTLTLTSAAPVTPESMNSKGISPMSGTFIQPWLYNSFTDEQWEQELTIWNELGIEYVIMGDTASINLQNDTVNAAYPTLLPNGTNTGDCVTKLFEKCSEFGIKIYIGMGNTPEGWPYFDLMSPDKAEMLVQVCGHFADIAEDLYNIYYEDFKETFAGFYFVPEIYNNSTFDNEANRKIYVERLAAGMNIVFDKINSLNPDLPFIFSPYVNMFGGDWVSKNTDSIGAFWKEFLETANFRDNDILCPQDSVGAGGNDLNLLEDVTKAYRYAVDNCGKDIKLWSNCEIFVQPRDHFFSDSGKEGVSYWGSCDVGRMIKQFEIVSKYVDRIFTFAFPHYMSPVTTVDGFYNTYIDYLKTGKLDDVKPIAPNKFRTSKSKKNNVDSLVVFWSGMYDNYGISKVNIYKNGELLTYRYPTTITSGTEPSYPNNFFDDKFDFNAESTTYEFEVIDCAGNVSERSTLVVEKDSIPNNVKLDKPYKGPVADDTSSADSSASNVESSSSEAPDSSKDSNLWKYITAGVAAIAVVGIAAALVVTKKKKNK